MKHLSLPLAAAILLSATNAAADDSQAPAMVVTATRLTPAPVGNPVYVIDRTAIEASPARSLSELLASVPGVSVRQLTGVTGSEGTIDLRGFGAAASVNTLVLVDGRRLNDVDLESTSLAGLPLANIERIEVQPGGGSVLYGDGASGGTINIVTRRASRNGGSASIAAGRFDSREALASLQLAGADSSLGLFAQHQETDGYRDNGALRRENGGLNLRHRMGQQELFVFTQGSRVDSGLPGNRTVDPTLGVDDLHGNPRGTDSPNDWAEEERTQTVAGWQAGVSDGLTLIIDGSQRYKHQRSFFDYGGGYSDYTDTVLGTLALTPRLQLDYGTGGLDHHLQAGVDFYRTDYTSKRGLTTVSSPVHTIGIDAESRSAYLLQTSRWQHSALSLGARQTRGRQQARDLFDATAPGAAFESQAAADRQAHDEEMYEAGLSQELQPGLTVRAGASRSVRFGTVDETFESDASFLRVFSPLLPQVGHNLEASLEFVREGLRLTATGYRQRLRNEIAFDPVSYTNNNLDPTQRDGFTLALSRSLPFGFSVDAALTRQEARFRSGPDAGNTVPLVPEHLSYAGLGWQATPLWRLSLSDTYTGSKFFDNDSSNDFGAKIPGYHRLDAKLALRWQALRASLGAYNLTDEDDHVDYAARSVITAGRYKAYPLPGRTWRLELGADF